MTDQSADDVQHNLDQAIGDAEADRDARATSLAQEAATAAAELAGEFHDLCDEVEVLNKNNKTGKRFQRVLAAVCLVLAIVATLSVHTQIQSCNDINQSRAGANILWHVGVGALIGPNPGPRAVAGEKAFFKQVDANYMPRDCSITAWFGS